MSACSDHDVYQCMCVNISCFYLSQVKEIPPCQWCMVVIAYTTQGRISWLTCCCIVVEMNKAVLNDISPSQVPSECVHEIYIKKMTTSKMI